MQVVLWVCISFVWPGIPNMGWLNWLERYMSVFCIDCCLFCQFCIDRFVMVTSDRLRIPPLIFLLSLSNLTQNQNIEIIQLQFFDAFTALQIELNFCLIFDDENGKQNWPKPWRHHKGSLVSRSLFNLAIIFLIYLVLFDKKFLDVLLQHWMGQ